MIRRIALAAALALALATSADCAPVTYTFMTKVSRVTFNINHLGFSHPFGTLKLAPGTFTFDNEDWAKSSVSVTLPIKTLDMGDTLWNAQIRSDPDWGSLFKYPEITFRSTKLERTDATHGTLYGNLTMGGVTRLVVLRLRVNKIGKNPFNPLPWAGFTATAVVKRSQFGINAYKGFIGEDIDVRIEIEASVGEASPE
jgi:polyisoprenoid-binding protein YceI